MQRLLIFGGTTEGRQLTEQLLEYDVQLHICVATEYGAELLPKKESVVIHTGRLDAKDMQELLKECAPICCIDATHPYAVEVTEAVIEACKKQGIDYIRVCRESMEQEGSLSGWQEQGKGTEACLPYVCVDSAEEAVRFLKDKAGRIFVTTGSKELETFTQIPDYESRLTVRVLPTIEAMTKCSILGFQGCNIIGMQGPFSEEMNYEMFSQTKADWLVTKCSGKAGGYIEKCEAALRLHMGIVAIGRPKETVQGKTVEQVMAYLQNRLGISKEMKESVQGVISLVAMGPGNPNLLTCEAYHTLEQADAILGAKRVLEIYPDWEKKHHFIGYKLEELQAYIMEHGELKRIAICYSGDIGFFSGAKQGELLLQALQKAGRYFTLERISGISSVTYFMNRIGMPWEQTPFVSCHGVSADLVSILKKNGSLCTLLGAADQLSSICERLREEGFSYVKIYVGEWLSYERERILVGTPETLKDVQVDALTVLYIRDEKAFDSTPMYSGEGDEVWKLV